MKFEFINPYICLVWIIINYSIDQAGTIMIKFLLFLTVLLLNANLTVSDKVDCIAIQNSTLGKYV